jgi:hypothetical protein
MIEIFNISYAIPFAIDTLPPLQEIPDKTQHFLTRKAKGRTFP